MENNSSVPESVAKQTPDRLNVKLSDTGVIAPTRHMPKLKSAARLAGATAVAGTMALGADLLSVRTAHAENPTSAPVTASKPAYAEDALRANIPDSAKRAMVKNAITPTATATPRFPDTPEGRSQAARQAAFDAYQAEVAASSPRPVASTPVAINTPTELRQPLSDPNAGLKGGLIGMGVAAIAVALAAGLRYRDKIRERLAGFGTGRKPAGSEPAGETDQNGQKLRDLTPEEEEYAASNEAWEELVGLVVSKGINFDVGQPPDEKTKVVKEALRRGILELNQSSSGPGSEDDVIEVEATSKKDVTDPDLKERLKGIYRKRRTAVPSTSLATTRNNPSSGNNPAGGAPAN